MKRSLEKKERKIESSDQSPIFLTDIQVRVHAPMTETLSTLDRNQLQKLVQYAINEDPAGILGKVFKHVGMS